MEIVIRRGTEIVSKCLLRRTRAICEDLMNFIINSKSILIYNRFIMKLPV